MTNNSFIFYEQQKKAFYEHEFEHLTLQELEEMVGKLRPKSNEFPAPECIFSKKFRFLPTTLEVMQERAKAERKSSPGAKEEVKKLVQSKAKETRTPKIKPKQRTKFGVFLESKSKSDTDSDNSFVIPNEFNDIITNVLRGNKLANEKDLELIIETTPITKLELKELKKRTEWVDELIMSDCETSEKPNKTHSRISCSDAQSPLIAPSFKNSVLLAAYQRRSGQAPNK
eukprot:TRINITY_DN7939_c0_g1_i13.p1 TRINITY_DN7939_c0_g1~~TRINITY_DN7939_c0_g1_i13.p1  ORF type:complete len:228 (-),score=91.28 TRINITY_DN7939_c0_g1_i13:391-1074(-)